MTLGRRVAFAHRRLVAAASLFCLTALAAGTASAEGAPTSPNRDVVVESQLLTPSAKRAVRTLTSRAAAPTAPLDVRIDGVRRLIEDARASGDPRPLGYAEQLLRELPVSSATLVLQATIEQSRHNFAAATKILDRALAIEPANAQALLTRASIAQVIGAFQDALSDCKRLESLHPDTAELCIGRNEALQGENARALERIQRVALRKDPTLRAWALSLAGDVELQNGDVAAAIRSYVSALSSNDDLYTRVVLAETLIAQGQPAPALTVLARAPATDAVLLQRWRALRAISRADPRAAAVERELDDRIAVAGARAESIHLREATRFTLERGDAAAALALARRNWNVQREPADLLLLLEAGRAVRDGSSVRDGRAWVASTGLRDRRVDTLLAAAR